MKNNYLQNYSQVAQKRLGFFVNPYKILLYIVILRTD